MAAERSSSPTPSERAKLDKEAKAREDEEQAKLPYKWTQTVKDVEVTIPIAGNLKSRDLVIELKKTKLKVQIKGQDPIIDVRLAIFLSFFCPFSCHILLTVDALAG